MNRRYNGYKMGLEKKGFSKNKKKQKQKTITHNKCKQCYVTGCACSRQHSIHAHAEARAVHKIE